MPISPKVASDGQAVALVLREHPGGCPAVHKNGVYGILPIRIPDGREMRPAVVGAVRVFLEFKAGAVAAAHALQQSPIGLILKLGKIGHTGLDGRNRRALVGADLCGRRLVDAITGFDCPAAYGRVLAVRLNADAGAEAGAVVVVIKLVQTNMGRVIRAAHLLNQTHIG